MKKFISSFTIFIMVISSLLFVGCSGNTSSTDSILAYFDLYAKHKKTEKLPISSEEADKVLKKQKDAFIQNFETAGTSKNKAEAIYNKFGELSEKVTIKAEEITNKNNTATVRLTAKPLDGSSHQKLMESKKTDLSNADSLADFLIEYYDSIVKDTKYKDKETSVDIILKKKDKVWTIDEKTEASKFESLILSK